MDVATDMSRRLAQIDEWKAEIRAIHDAYMTRLQKIYDEVGSGEAPRR